MVDAQTAYAVLFSCFFALLVGLVVELFAGEDK